MKAKRAFTLIELLVVIAIIAILAAILFPVFAQAKMAAKKTGALSGAKQLTLGVLMYTNDADDTYPMGSGACWWVPTDGGWTYDTQPYVKNLELLRDPTDPKSKAGWPDWLKTNANGINISYVSNGFITWTGSINDMVGVMGLVQNLTDTRCGPQNWMGRAITTASNVTNPSGTVMFSERFGSQPTWGVGLFIAGQNWWDSMGFPGNLPNGARVIGGGNDCNAQGAYVAVANGATLAVNKNCKFGAVSAPYSDQAVFSFTDGSAKVMNPVKTNPDQNNKPAENMWNAYR
ncbi:MAG: prepilin-type N-terminal cleavage/methylation domain-containing protein [Armatimonadetes bacterium]|nr:prepilin-type N-terminal cleavage/methylation domain-containing protein [Armatimonadota bacterium]